MVTPKIITVLVSIVLSMSSLATTIKYDGPWMWKDLNVKTTTSIGNSGYPVVVTSTGTIAISGYKKEVTSLEIPKKIEWTAEEWGENYLEYGDHILLTKVVYDLDVVAIGVAAFNGSSESRYRKLEHVIIPNTVTKIGTQAFISCSGLKSIAIPDSVKEIGERCFYGCMSLASITLPKQIETILPECFYGCTSLSEVVIPNSVTNIRERAFYCAGKAENTPYMNLVIPPSVKSIGDNAFGYMYNVTNLVVQGVPKVNYHQFEHMENLVSLAFGPGVEEVEDYFSQSYFYNLKRVSFESDDMKRIGRLAFYGGDYRNRLEEVVLPRSLESLDACAFEYCTELKDVHVRDTSYTIPKSLKEVGEYCFRDCSSITNVVFEPGLTVLGDEMFYACTSIKEIVVPGSVETIGESAFYGCSSLAAVIISSGVETIGSSAFSSCSSLSDVIISRGVKTIGSSAFSSCSSLAEIVIPCTVETIGKSVFSSCSHLTKVTLEEGLKTLGERMFYGGVIKEIFIPKSIVEIGSSCFSSCKNLKEITLEDGLPLLGASMFSGCTSLQNVSIPGSVRQLGASSFSGCTGLMTVNLSEGLGSIEQSAFQGCIGLRAMSFPESLQTIGNTAFSGCTSLSTISFPSGVNEVGVGAFSGCSVKSMLFNNSNGEYLDLFAKGSLRTLFLGKSADGITGGLLSDCSSLETIMTAAANPNYSVDDCGVLFDKGKSKLIKYPCAASHQSYTAPETVKSVDDGAFAFASALQDIDFPASLTTVGESAFDWCLGLGYVCFPATLRTIGAGAFTTCPSLEDLYFEGNAPTIGDNQFWYSSPVFHVQENTTGWDAVAERFDVEVVIGEGSGGEDSPALTMDWLAQYPTLWSAAGGDLATAAKMIAANGLTLEECYIAGLDPTDPDSKFEARIDIIDGQPVVTWKPQLDKADAALRTYTTYGCSEPGGDWIDFDAASPEIKATLRFFKVCVDMK